MKQGILVFVVGLCIGIAAGFGWYFWKRNNTISQTVSDTELTAGCALGQFPKAWVTVPGVFAVRGALLERSANGEEFLVIPQSFSKSYSADDDVAEGNTYEYRINADGKIISNVATLTVDDEHCVDDVQP